MLLSVLRPSLGLRAGSPFHLHLSSLNNTSSSTSSKLLSSFSTSARTPIRTPTRLETHALSLPYRLRSQHHQRRAPPLLFTTLALSSGLLAPQLFQYPTRNDTADFSSGGGGAPYSHGRDAKTPLSTDGGRTLNPAAVRQISFGAVLGLGLGVLFSALSRMLVLVLGVGIVVWQYAARRGYNIVPVDRMQRYVKGVNLRSAINDNAAFKISFGLMFALTAFGEF